MIRLLCVGGCLLFLLSNVANANGWGGIGHRQAPLVCGAGQATCRGPYGLSCYQPSAGERCMQGLVCGPSEMACLGPYGRSCYQPSAGERCSQGLVCGPGYAACIRDGRAQCYRPSAGETCN